MFGKWIKRFKESKTLIEEIDLLKKEIEGNKNHVKALERNHKQKINRILSEKLETWELPYDFRNKIESSGEQSLARRILSAGHIEPLLGYSDLNELFESAELRRNEYGISYQGERPQQDIEIFIQGLAKAYQRLTEKMVSYQQTILRMETSTTKDIEIGRLKSSLASAEIKADALKEQLKEAGKFPVPEEPLEVEI